MCAAAGGTAQRPHAQWTRPALVLAGQPGDDVHDHDDEEDGREDEAAQAAAGLLPLDLPRRLALWHVAAAVAAARVRNHGLRLALLLRRLAHLLEQALGLALLDRLAALLDLRRQLRDLAELAPIAGQARRLEHVPDVDERLVRAPLGERLPGFLELLPHRLQSARRGAGPNRCLRGRRAPSRARRPRPRAACRWPC